MYKNDTNISLPLAVWLAVDEYDHSDDPNTISATSLIKPIKELILSQRVHPDFVEPEDLNNLVASRIGTSIHNGVEGAWVNHHKEALTRLGYPEKLIEKVEINPTHPTEGSLPVYLEQRTHREIEGYTVSGKYDLVMDGRVHDVKSTSVFTYISGSNTDKYCKQGSIYRWLNPDIITADDMAIQFIFTDWKGMNAKTNPNYPKSRCIEQRIPLMSIAETEEYIRQRLRTLKQNNNADEGDLPHCTPEELWQRDPVFKYYKNPEKRTRATKNFDNIHDANARLSADNHVGVITEVPGEVVACRYCSAITVCRQKDQYIAEGRLNL